MVWYSVGISRVEEKVSARPNGIINGIQPEEAIVEAK